MVDVVQEVRIVPVAGPVRIVSVVDAEPDLLVVVRLAGRALADHIVHIIIVGQFMSAMNRSGMVGRS